MAQADVMPRTQQRPSGRPGDPCIMVIFGAAGDLTQRKLIPALYNLAKVDLLPREFAILGVAHNPMSDDEFRNFVAAMAPEQVAIGMQSFIGTDIGRIRRLIGLD